MTFHIIHFQAYWSYWLYDMPTSTWCYYWSLVRGLAHATWLGKTMAGKLMAKLILYHYLELVNILAHVPLFFSCFSAQIWSHILHKSCCEVSQNFSPMGILLGSKQLFFGLLAITDILFSTICLRFNLWLIFFPCLVPF